MSSANSKPHALAIAAPFVEGDGVHHRHRNGIELLNGIGFSITAGEIAALIGRSGRGKSALLHILAGLIKPTAGSIRIDGSQVDGPSHRRILLFQQPSLFPWLSERENIGLGLRFTGRRREVPARVAELLRLVELEDYATRNVQDPSGGQQQRVALARSLAPSPQVLLLDEPFSSLDIFTRAAL